MKMTEFEKRFVNRREKAEGNIKKVRQCFEYIDIGKVNNVLELGCGFGFVSAFLSENYPLNVHGTDFDPEQIASARHVHPESNQLHFSVADATRLTFKDLDFDLVLSQNVFHHIPNWPLSVKQIYRVLRPQGYFIWIDLVFSKFIKKIFQPVTKNYGLYTSAEIQSAFAMVGFKELFSEGVAAGPFRSQQMVLQKM
ncbi:MAG: class I SAM-dependent methyltransferase [Candidatus Aminicenantes bacterium]|nr:class I SAM-dependent methyltransferase [Candidatus Aminicenantes bacterium]